MKQKNWFGNRPSKRTAPPPRSREEIQDLYNRACNEAGDIQYKLVAMSGRLEELTKFRGELNAELARLEHAEGVLRERIAAERQEAEQSGMPTAPPPPTPPIEEQH